jgi:nitrite reductase/ring-hydroxylating ferredoxin subunit
MDDSCPHQGAALSGGKLKGAVVACPAHGIQFDVTRGCAIASPELCNRTYRVSIEDGMVMLER